MRQNFLYNDFRRREAFISQHILIRVYFRIYRNRLWNRLREIGRLILGPCTNIPKPTFQEPPQNITKLNADILADDLELDRKRLFRDTQASKSYLVIVNKKGVEKVLSRTDMMRTNDSRESIEYNVAFASSKILNNSIDRNEEDGSLNSSYFNSVSDDTNSTTNVSSLHFYRNTKHSQTEGPIPNYLVNKSYKICHNKKKDPNINQDAPQKSINIEAGGHVSPPVLNNFLNECRKSCQREKEFYKSPMESMKNYKNSPKKKSSFWNSKFWRQYVNTEKCQDNDGIDYVYCYKLDNNVIFVNPYKCIHIPD
ncbi:unnamed protein product [Gordionus sp. m RMFG-2023]